jgi:F0F1-type ATP synthase assembly protein I
LGSKCSRKIAETARVITRRLRWTEKDDESQRSIENSGASQSLLGSQSNSDGELATSRTDLKRKKRAPKFKQNLPFWRIFTPNVVNTLMASAIIGIYMGSFQSLWLVFLSTHVSDPATETRHLPFVFGGGLGMPPRDVGFAMAILGAIGISLQIFVYPVVTQRIGVIRCWRIFLYSFPIAAICAPFLALVPSQSPPPAAKDGPIIWLGVCIVLFIQVVGRVFVGPATAILINNCSPHPSVLATTHGIAQTVASAVRTVSPVVVGWLYGVSLDHGVVGAVWWGLAAIALYGCVASQWVVESNGSEIRLPGDDEIEDEARP